MGMRSQDIREKSFGIAQARDICPFVPRPPFEEGVGRFFPNDVFRSESSGFDLIAKREAGGRGQRSGIVSITRERPRNLASTTYFIVSSAAFRG